MDRIDFRSDTVSWPTPAMREAMATAVVGDDVYGEDPTINQLEALAAEKVGKEAALFVASGTMGNIVSALSHATRGDEMIVGHDSHIILWEAGSVSSLGGIMTRQLPTDRMGRMALDAVEAAVRDTEDAHHPRTRLIHVENSYGDRGGYPLPLDYFAGIRDVADRHGLAVEMDGARLFNAAVALGVPAAEVTRHVDSVSFCLSKGLCAPVGSMVCGTAEFIDRARRMRKALGGGMRQAGILAAAGIVALNEMIDRLAEDHRRARMLADRLAETPGITLERDYVCTNIVYFSLTDEVELTAPAVVKQLRERANIWLGDENDREFRAITHYWISDADVAAMADTLRDILNTA
jgi:threonine aldolase